MSTGCYNCRWKDGDYAFDEDYDAEAPCTEEEREERKRAEDEDDSNLEECDMWESEDCEPDPWAMGCFDEDHSLSSSDRNLEFGGVNYP